MNFLKPAFRFSLKFFLGFMVLILLYFMMALICSKITVNGEQNMVAANEHVFVSTNGVHSDVIIPIALLDSAFLRNMYFEPDEKYLALGWGDRNFYINTPEWADLTVKNALTAMFWKSPTLMHVTRYTQVRRGWKKVPVSSSQLNQLIKLAFKDFVTDNKDQYVRLLNESYGNNDNFYKARGSYHCFKTCNSWTNSVLKESGLPASLWTPFDFGVMDNY